MLEREGALAQLGAALRRAHNGGGHLVLIEGPAGIGKTRLLEEAFLHARVLGMDVRVARGGPLEQGYGFGIVRQLLEPPLAKASPDERAELLSGSAVLAEPVISPSAVTDPEETLATQTVLHGLYWLVANLSERRPLVLAVDDAHWADEPSVRFLLYLARRLEGMPIALALALRTGEAAEQPELLRALRVEARPPVISPEPLSAGAAASLSAALLARAVRDDLWRACHTATGGNPFLLTELLHQLSAMPDDVHPADVERMASRRVAAAILLRVGRLGAQAGALVRAVSVLGEGASLDRAAALAAIDSPAAAALAAALADAEVLEPGRYPLRFVHPIVRSAVYDDIPRAERARLHARAAELLSARREGIDAAATHLLHSDPAGDPTVVEALRAAARRAMSRGAPETAVALLARAEREGASGTPQPELALERGTAAARAGRPDGVTLLREAFELTCEQPARARAGLELAFALGVSSGESAAAVTVLERAREGLDDEALRALIDARMVMFHVLVPSTRPRLSAYVRDARKAIERPPADALRVLLGPLAADLLYQGAQATQVERLAEQALGDGELMRRDVATESDFALGAVAALIVVGRLRSAQRHLEEGIAHARARGSPFALARLCAFRALVYLRLGELAPAESDAHLALSVKAAWGIPHAIASAVRAQVQIERGDLDAAQQRLADVPSDPAMLEVMSNQILREARARLLLARSEPSEALPQLRACAEWEHQAVPQDRLGPVPWRSLAALAHHQLAQTEQARKLARDQLRLARDFGAAPQLGEALRTLGIVEGGSTGLSLLEEAVSVLRASEARLEHARCVVAHGAILRRCGQRTAATEALRAGLELADRCDATALVDLATSELRIAGARPRRVATRGRASLTPGEHRVSGLAAQGMSNKQIAQALFVTLRTVEMHLSNAYRKLEISSREQLPRALAL